MDRRRLRFLEDALEDEDVCGRYHAKVAVTESHWWFTGAIMRSGHGRYWVGTDANGRDVVVLAHRFGYALEHGATALLDAPVLRHTCDEAPCQRPAHLEPADRNHDNHLERLLRRHRIGSPLRDVRGRGGRARAMREAVLTGADVVTVHCDTSAHTCPDPGALPGIIDPDGFDAMVIQGDGILTLADLYVMGLADRTLLAHRLHVAWQAKGYREWIDIETARGMFREARFAVDGNAAAPPAGSLVLFRAAREEYAAGLSWTTCPQRAAGIGAYNGDGSRLWRVTISPDRLLGYLMFEEEFVVDLAGLTPELADPTRARVDRRSRRAVARWMREPVHQRARQLYGGPWSPL